MTFSRCSTARLLALLAALSAGLALAERPADRLVATRPGPLYGTPDGGEGELIAFDGRLAPALASLAAGERLAVDAWPVAPGVSRTMVLTRTDVYAPDARIVAIGKGGEVAVPRSTWAFFQGRDPSGLARVAVALDPLTGAMRGLTSSDRGLHELLPPDTWTGGRHRLAAPEDRNTDGTPRTWKCSEEALPLMPPTPPAGDGAGRESLAGREALATFSKYAVVAIDTDNEFMGLKFSDNTTNATNYIANLFNLMNLIYERDVQLHLLQGYTILRLSTVADPYVQNSGSNASGAELSEFSSYWSAHYGGVKRMVAAMLSGKQPGSSSASGIAWLGTLCNTGFGYSFSKVFLFAQDTSSNDVLITAHEIGHNFGSPHTHCYSPPADNCYNQESGCWAGAQSCPGVQVYNGYTSNGTLMSYCHLLSCAGGATLVFHPRTLLEYFNSRIAASTSCIFNGAAAPTGPAVTGIVATTGSTTGGASVTISGSGFVSGATAAFVDLTGSVSLTSVTFVNAGQLTAVTPAHAAGVVDVVVFNPDNSTGTLRNGYAYTTAGTPPPPPPVSAATTFHAVTPCRLVDTRNAAGPLGGPSIGAGGLRSFVAVGNCNVPAVAVAISANVTAVSPAAAGDLLVYPNGIASPPVVSTLSFRAGRTRANNTVVYVASDGSFLVKNNAPGALDFVLDVNGFFQ
jgi:hypothetical protein